MDNTLSILPSDGANNEFPVLKAFQQYIDAEQAKARKRMLGLSVFFIILLVVVVVTFVLVLTTVVNRNQALSDKLLDYALREREKSVQVVQPPAQPVAQAPQPSVQDLLKPFIERLEREQAAMKAIYEKQRKEVEAKYEQQQKEAEAKAAASLVDSADKIAELLSVMNAAAARMTAMAVMTEMIEVTVTTAVSVTEAVTTVVAARDATISAADSSRHRRWKSPVRSTSSCQK